MGRLLRLGLPGLAVYALVLQAFLAGAAPVAAFDAAGLALCAQSTDSSDHSGPAQPGSHQHDLCVAHCSAPSPLGFASIAAAQLRVRDVSSVSRAFIADARDPARPARQGPGARAPPKA
jgi:hypothetical protein